jgi:hypothetical protein
VSRIFDALRKYEQEKAGTKAAPNNVVDMEWPELSESSLTHHQ